MNQVALNPVRITRVPERANVTTAKLEKRFPEMGLLEGGAVRAILDTRSLCHQRNDWFSAVPRSAVMPCAPQM